MRRHFSKSALSIAAAQALLLCAGGAAAQAPAAASAPASAASQADTPDTVQNVVVSGHHQQNATARADASYSSNLPCNIFDFVMIQQCFEIIG